MGTLLKAINYFRKKSSVINACHGPKHASALFTIRFKVVNKYSTLDKDKDSRTKSYTRNKLTQRKHI